MYDELMMKDERLMRSMSDTYGPFSPIMPLDHELPITQVEEWSDEERDNAIAAVRHRINLKEHAEKMNGTLTCSVEGDMSFLFKYVDTLTRYRNCHTLSQYAETARTYNIKRIRSSK